jgi:hypothetical protein
MNIHKYIYVIVYNGFALKGAGFNKLDIEARKEEMRDKHFLKLKKKYGFPENISQYIAI